MFWLIVEKFVVLFGSAVPFFLLGNVMGESVLGQVSIALSIAFILAIPGTLGLRNVLIRELPQLPSPYLYTRRLATLSLCVNALIAGAGVTVLTVFPPSDGQLVFIAIAIASNLFSIHSILRIPFEVFSRFRDIALIYVFVQVVVFSMKVFSISNHRPDYFLGAIFLENLILSVVFFTISKVEVDSDKVYWRQLAPLCKEGVPLIFATLAWVTITKIDTIQVGFLSSVSAAGQYSAASRIFEILIVPLNLLLMVRTPMMQKALAQNDLRLYRSEVLLSFRSLIIYAVITFGSAAIFSRRLVDLLYGEGFEATPMCIVILSMNVLLFALYLLSGRIFVNARKTKLVLVRSIFALCINIALNFTLIPRFGAIGAAIASTLALLLALAGSFVFSEVRTTLSNFHKN